MDTTFLKAWLPFDESTTQDLCGNTWTAYGSPSIGSTNAHSENALQLPSGSYLACDSVTIGGQDFTICGWCYFNSSSGSWARVFEMPQTDAKDTNILFLGKFQGSTNWTLTVNGTRANFAGTFDQLIHFEVDYQHDTATTKCFINGELKATLANQTIARVARKIRLGKSSWNADGAFIGSIDEFQIFDGVALHTTNFTPPTDDDYIPVKLDLLNPMTLTFDVERKVKTKWRYVNMGDTDDLIIASTILTDLPADKSKTGYAFYQTTRAKCFDIPATDDIWIKFDLYHYSGPSRFRVYDDKNGSTANGFVLTQNSSTQVALWSYNGSANGQRKTFDGVLKANTLQTWLLHMEAGTSDGILELWCDGVFVGSWTGNVNNGEDFANIYLQSDDANNLFSNVIISNSEIDFGEGFQIFSADVERRVSNAFEISFDVQRIILLPIVVPLIGDHFNHYVQSLTLFRDAPQRIILPKNSVAYIRATGPGSIKVFSDSDNTGKVTGAMYAGLGECNSVFIQSTDSPLGVIRRLIKYFVENDGTRTSDAINYATGGKYPHLTRLENEFCAEINNLPSGNFFLDEHAAFLKDKCDIILGNEDTGAITGSDAGELTKTAQSVVPENIPPENWVTPPPNSTMTVYGLTVHFPSAGADGSTLTDAENHILAGLNSVWIKSCLKLIKESLGIGFDSDSAFIHDIDIKFVNSADSHFLAYVEPTIYHDLRTMKDEITGLSLIINMYFYTDVDFTSEDGLLIPSSSHYDSAGYLDRSIAHELTHAVMMANIKRFLIMYPCITEGMAEIVHGIDDLRGGTIINLLTKNHSSVRAEIQKYNGTANENTYAVGYMLLRYLAKQGVSEALVPETLVISNLLISDGATDSDYNALTDNTRQIFYPDVLRTLFKQISPAIDVEILDVIPIEFFADIKRALIATLILFPRNSEDFFQPTQDTISGGSSSSVTVPANTYGLQSFEVTIAEQQITDQVKFTGIIPFDILQQVKGQYFDYRYNMRVERVQQQGILYSCDCCSDIDQLLFTQMNYNIPPSTWYRKVNGEIVGESETIEIETHYPPASEHVKKIAAALGLNPVMQFDDFLSTVLMDDLGGVTYNDLIRDVFGWSSRVPTQLINVFIRDGNLFVIERGHEAHTVDITNAEKTLPIITKELVRTSWGSSVTSETEIKEVEKHYAVPVDTIIDSGGGGGDEKYCDVKVEFSSPTGYGYTTYSYNSKGLLRKTNTHIFEYEDNKNTESTVEYSYDDDGTMIKTETHTRTYDINGNTSSTSTLLEKKYGILPNGEKFLASEYSATYEDGKLVDWKQTTHSPSRVGQSHTTTVNDGGIAGAIGGQNTGDDRVTPFSRSKAKSLTNYINSETGEWKTSKTEKGTTIYGLSLYDSSFPIHDEDKLIQVTNAIKDLNRKTQETVSLTIYNFPHIIDFNDKIILYNAEFFLGRNTAMTTPRIISEQHLTLVRWY